MSEPTLILGGGPSGLACAWTLARDGERAIVLEREARPGGLCATVEHQGYRFDLGGHRFVSSNAALAAQVATWLGDDLLVQERRSVVLCNGRAFRYPLEAMDLLRSLGWSENARAFGGYAAARARVRWRNATRHRKRESRELEAERTFEEWVRARFGGPLYERFFGPYTEKLWGIPPSEISAEWAAQRIGLLNLGDAALRMLGLRRAPLRTYARRYYYPRLGMGQLFDRIAEEARRLGAEIMIGTEVVGFVRGRGGRVDAVRARQGASGREIEIPCRAVYSTIPLPATSRLVTVRPHPAERELRFRAIRFLNLLLARERVSENTWMYVADPRFKIARIQEPRNRSASMAPPGCTSLMLEVPCDVGDGVWTAADADLVPALLDELTALGFDVRRDVVGAFSTRVANGYPVYRVGYERARDELLTAVRDAPNVLVGGRQGLFRYVFLDAAMEMGEAAAGEIRSGRMDPAPLDAIRRDRSLLEANATTA